MSDVTAQSGASLTRSFRIVAACLLASPLAGFAGALVLAFTLLADDIAASSTRESEFIQLTLSSTLGIGTFFGATWGQLATFAIGLPAHLWLKRKTTRQAWMYAFAGAGAGLIFGVLFVYGMVFGRSLAALADIAALVLASLTAGAIGGFVFWLIRRPDRDAQPRPPETSGA